LAREDAGGPAEEVEWERKFELTKLAREDARGPAEEVEWVEESSFRS